MKHHQFALHTPGNRAPADDYLTPVDERFEEPERDIHEAPLDCALLQSEMLATLAMRDAGRRRAAALRAARQNRRS